MSNARNDRLQALRVLLDVLQKKIPLDAALQSAGELSSLSKAICYGVCRHYVRLQMLVDYLIKKRPSDFDLWLVLLTGMYQLQFLNKPEYASVKETVDLLHSIKKSWAKGLVNAVLRRFCRERADILARLQVQDEFVFGHPPWLVSTLERQWPTQWREILIANDAHPPMSLRVNARHGTRDAYLERLSLAGIGAKAQDHSPAGITLDTACDVSELPGFADGDVSVQDQAAQLAVSLLALKPGLRVLDACAAPGGKTCHILESEPLLADCVAVDIDERRLQRVRDNLARCGLEATLRLGDALSPDTWWDGQLFERILLDAPCSATGVIRRHPDIKLLRTSEDIRAVAAIQAELLTTMWPLLAPGGILVYATCSVIREENEHQIARFLDQNPDCRCVTGDQPWGLDTGFGWQLFPGQTDCDGFFYSVLHRNES